MDSKFKLSKYFHTSFIKILIDNNPVDNLDILYSFASNGFYDCDAGVAQLGGDMFLRFSNGKKIFECETCDDLISIDNSKFPHNDIFHNISRIKLPSFELILQDDSIVDVKAFLSVYKNGFCGITYAYNNVNKFVEKNNINKIVQWGYVKYIKLPKEITDIMHLEVVNANSGPIVVDIFEFMEPYSTVFDFMKSVVLNILINAQNKRRISTYSIQPSKCFAYFQLEAVAMKKDTDTSDLIKLFGSPGNNYIEESLREEICNLSYSDGITYLLTQRSLLEVSYDKNSNSKIVELFHSIDYLLNEKNKLYDALERIIKIENQPELLDEKIISQFKDNYLEVLKSNFVYDFSISGEYNLIMMIKKVLKNDIILDELERIFNRYQNKSILMAEKREKNKELAEKAKEKINNNIIQFLTLLLAIPAVSNIVDIFYSINVKYPIIFNIGIAKLLFTSITLFIIIYFFYRIINSKENG